MAYNLADMSPHPTVSEIQLLFPTTPQQIIDLFRNHVKSLPKVEGNKHVAIIDSIISNPGALIPWQEIVKICKEEGIWSVVDAAHSIGQEQKIDLTEAAPDFWVSVCDTCLPNFFSTYRGLPRGRIVTNGCSQSARSPCYTSPSGMITLTFPYSFNTNPLTLDLIPAIAI
jgi:hypothetical protein